MNPGIYAVWGLRYLLAKYCESKHNKVGDLVTLVRAIIAVFVFGWMTSQACTLPLKLLVQFVLWCPGLWIPRILVPLGAPRLAYYVTRSTFPFGFWCEPKGGAAFMAALACAHRRRPSERALAFVEKRLAVPVMTAGGAAIAGHAIVASLRGDLECARRLFFLVSRLHWRHVTHTVRAHAFEWLAADALEHGVSETCFDLPWWRRPRFTWFLKRLRDRVAYGSRRISTASLVALWMIAPHRRAGLRLLRAALGQPNPPGAKNDLHSVVTGAAAWQATLDDSELRLKIGRRLAGLGGKSAPGDILRSLREGVVSELVERLEHEPSQLSEESPPLALEARDRLISRYCGEVEEGLRVVDSAEKEKMEPVLMWEHWASLQRDLLRLRALTPDDPGMAHHLCYPDLHNWGVHLVNQENQAMLAHDIFYFSAKEAARARDTEAKKVCRANAAMCR